MRVRLDELLARGYVTAHQLWIVALAMGMRRGEVLGLRWKDMDFERRVLRVWQTVGVLHGVLEIKAPKTKSSRREIRTTAKPHW